jgi:hypothetical protein
MPATIAAPDSSGRPPGITMQAAHDDPVAVDLDHLDRGRRCDKGDDGAPGARGERGSTGPTIIERRALETFSSLVSELEPFFLSPPGWHKTVKDQR